MEVAKLVLEYARAVLSAPVVTGAVVVVAFVLFKDALRELILRGFRFRAGEYEFESQRDALSLSKVPPPPGPPALPKNPTPDQAIAAYRTEAKFWEFSFLNHFLVRGTQMVLDWLARPTTNATLSLFDAGWRSVIQDPKEREAIINALQTHNLIQIDKDQLIHVTDKGREYLGFRGLLTPLPPPPAKWKTIYRLGAS